MARRDEEAMTELKVARSNTSLNTDLPLAKPVSSALYAVSLLDVIRDAWGWVGLDPVEVVGENDFGNLIVKDVFGKYWRLCPEDCYCRVVASSREEFDELSKDQEFLKDWHMSALVDAAFEKLGVLPEGRKYCLKIPGALGGAYGSENIDTISLEELVQASGHIAREIKDLPAGAQVKLKVIE